MGTLVSPILSATLAMPFARLWMERHAWEEREARLSIVDDAEVELMGFWWGESVENGNGPFYFVPYAELLRPEPDIQSRCLNFSACDCDWAQVRQNDLLARNLRQGSVFSHLDGWSIEQQHNSIGNSLFQSSTGQNDAKKGLSANRG